MGARDRYIGHSRVDRGDVEAPRARETLPPTKTGGEPAAGCRWDRVAEEGWRGDAGKPDAAGADAGGICGRGEECGSSIVRMPTHRISQRRDEWGTMMWVTQQQP